MHEISNNSSEESSIIVARRSIKYGKPLEAVIGIFREYGKNSTIHGIRYLGERHRSTSERLFWISVFTILIGICGHLIKNIWTHWNESPLIVSFTERTGLISEIPFPSILICPEIKAHKNKFDFRKMLHVLQDDKESLTNLTTTEELYLEAFLHLCNPKNLNDLKLSISTAKTTWQSIYEMSPEMYDTLSYISFNSSVYEPWDVLEQVITENGLCFYFNGLNYEHYLRRIGNVTEDQEIDAIGPPWSAEEGYRYNVKNSYPWRPSNHLKDGSLNFAIYGDKNDINSVCQNTMPGAKIYLLSPSDLPQGQWHYIKIPFNAEILINIRPNFIVTSKEARAYIPQRRGCFFENERYLRFYKIYTQSNCNYECLINYTISTCGCVAFHMPDPIGVRNCEVSDIPCYSQAGSDLVYKEFERGLEKLRRNEYFKTECNCLPACASLEYDFEASVDYIDWKHPYTDHHEPLANVVIRYDKKYFPVIHKNYEELYKTIDFLANCGNFLGLFMGVSVLSLVELIYFFTFRLVANIKMRYRNNDILK